MNAGPLPGTPAHVGQHTLTGPKLLVVEADATLSDQLRQVDVAYDMIVARDRAQAMDAVREYSPQVAVLDLDLPSDSDGAGEAHGTLRAILDAAPATKVIAASRRGAPTALRAIDAGAWDIATKPLDTERLGLAVRRAFHVHALEAENRRLASAASWSAGAPGPLPRMAELVGGLAIGPEDLDPCRKDRAEVIGLRAVREAADRRAIAAALARTDGNISGTARLLGISRPTLYDLMKQYGMRS